MLPNLPMGTIVTVCMLIGLLIATPYAMNKRLKALPVAIARTFGGIVLLGGVWNTFWHGASCAITKNTSYCVARPFGLVSRLRN